MREIHTDSPALFQSKPHLVDPIDFENFVVKNKTVLQNDPQRELLLYPPDDISVRSSYESPMKSPWTETNFRKSSFRGGTGPSPKPSQRKPRLKTAACSRNSA